MSQNLLLFPLKKKKHSVQLLFQMTFGCTTTIILIFFSILAFLMFSCKHFTPIILSTGALHNNYVSLLVSFFPSHVTFSSLKSLFFFLSYRKGTYLFKKKKNTKSQEYTTSTDLLLYVRSPQFLFQIHFLFTLQFRR